MHNVVVLNCLRNLLSVSAPPGFCFMFVTPFVSSGHSDHNLWMSQCTRQCRSSKFAWFSLFLILVPCLHSSLLVNLNYWTSPVYLYFRSRFLTSQVRRKLKSNMYILWTLNTKILLLPITDRQIGFWYESCILLNSFFFQMLAKVNSQMWSLDGFSGIRACASFLPPQMISYLYLLLN